MKRRRLLLTLRMHRVVSPRDTDVAARRHKEMNVFTSSDAQRLVQSRLKRLGHLDPVQQMRMKKPKALRQRIAKALEKVRSRT
eukprot:SAG11_NODE_642_length_8006_cov_6.996965_10_plen_83_part_00